MSPDGTRLLDEGEVIYRGPVAEGPKVYKRDGWYYISLPEGGVERGGQTLLRARNLRGPWERRVVMPDGSPHQGGIVDLDNGESWFLGFKSTGFLGRVVHLEPVKWGDDGWPVFGDGGRPVVGGRKPAIAMDVPIVHPATSDAFDSPTLQPQWQWNHNPRQDSWSLEERPGWLRLHGLSAAEISLARNTLTQKLWGQAGRATLTLDVSGLTDGQRAGLAFMSGKVFDAVGVLREGGVSRLFWGGSTGPELPAGTRIVHLRGEYEGAEARLSYSLDGRSFTDIGLRVTLRFSQWKGARVAIFCHGEGGGFADFDEFRFEHGSQPMPLDLPDHGPIDRKALVERHNPVLRAVDYLAPLTVGNGGFAFTVDVTGLQTFGDAYYANGIPLETLARWCWVSEANPEGHTLADAMVEYRQADGSTIELPTRMDNAAAAWLRRNPRLHPLGRFSLDWDKPDGSPIVPADITDLEQTLDLWRGTIRSRYKLGGEPVEVVTACDPESDTIAVRVESPLVARGELRVRVAFRGATTRRSRTPRRSTGASPRRTSPGCWSPASSSAPSWGRPTIWQAGCRWSKSHRTSFSCSLRKARPCWISRRVFPRSGSPFQRLRRSAPPARRGGKPSGEVGRR
jgi:hypothetical protein